MATDTDMPSTVPFPGTSPVRTSSSTWMATCHPIPRSSRATIRSVGVIDGTAVGRDT